MSKNKFIKKLLVAGLCALTATAMIGATACNKNNDGDNKDPNPNPNPGVEATDTYTVTLNAGNGTLAGESSITVDSGDTIPASQNPTPPAGYTFLYWEKSDHTPVIPGVTQITSNITLTAVYQEEAAEEAKSGSWTVSNSATDTYAAGDTIDDNELFTVKSSVAATYGKGKDGADLNVSGTNANGGFTATQAIKQVDTIAKGAYAKSLYTVTAKADAKVKLLVHFVNDSWNSDRVGAEITYSLGSGAVQKVLSVKRTEALIAIEVDIPEGETLNIGVNNISTDTGKLWLFSVEGTEQQNKTAVNYYNGAEEEDNLILSQLVEAGATLVTPSTPETIEYSSKFLGWYDAATGGNTYTFDVLDSSLTEVNIYAHYQISDVTINYYGADNTTVYKTVYAYSGETTTAIEAPAKGDGSDFLYWSETVDGSAYDFTVALTAGTVNLYPVYQAAVEGTVVGDIKLDSGIAASANNVYTVTDGAETPATLATVTIITATGSKKSNSGVVCGETSVDVEWQAGAGTDGKVIELKLEEGYTYTVEMYLGSSGSAARTVDLYKTVADGDPAKQGETQTTGNGTKVTTNCKWTELTGGDYYLLQSNNIMICYFVITAVPVQA